MKEQFDDIKNICKTFGYHAYKYKTFIDGKDFLLYIFDACLSHINYRGKYLFMKGFKLDISEIINIPPILDKKKYEMVSLPKFVSKYEKDILEFTSVLEQNFPKEDLVMMYKNLGNLKMQIVDDMKSNGSYDPYDNSILIKKDKYPTTLPHELFHLTTSRRLINNSVCGFHFVSKGLSIGLALNEGYTDIMANRYFKKDIRFSAYGREIRYFDILEKLFGTKVIEKLYMRADLVELIKLLTDYKEEKDVINFIIKIDDILRIEKCKYNDIITTYDLIKFYDLTNKIIEANLFLSSLYFKKSGLEDYTESLTDYDKYKELYTVYENKEFKNIYMESLTLYNMRKNRKISYYAKLEELYRIIGYEKLENVCFKNGMYAIVNELIKYTSLEEIYKYLELLDEYLNPLISFNVDTYNKIEEFNFGLLVRKSQLLDNIEPSIESGFGDSNLFWLYRNTVEHGIKNNRDILGDTDYFDYDDASRLYEIVGKTDMLKYYLNGDIDSFKNKLRKYSNVETIMRVIDAKNEKLKCFLDNLNLFEKSKHM